MRTARRVFAVASLAALSMGLASCGNLMGFLASVVDRPQTREAVYELPEHRKLLVFVETAGHETEHSVARKLTEVLNERLKSEDVTHATVPYERQLDLAAYAGLGALEPVSAAERLDADLVLLVRIDEFSLQDSPAGGLWKGRMAATVKVLDVPSGQRLGPGDDPAGYAIEPVETPMTTNTSSDYAHDLTVKLCAIMSDRIAKLFYEHEVRPSEQNR